MFLASHKIGLALIGAAGTAIWLLFKKIRERYDKLKDETKIKAVLENNIALTTEKKRELQELQQHILNLNEEVKKIITQVSDLEDAQKALIKTKDYFEKQSSSVIDIIARELHNNL